MRAIKVRSADLLTGQPDAQGRLVIRVVYLDGRAERLLVERIHQERAQGPLIIFPVVGAPRVLMFDPETLGRRP